MYECTVNSTDTGFTILTGAPNFYGCTGPSGNANLSNQLALEHAYYNQGVTARSVCCNKGTIVGKSLSAVNGIYISQFNITVSREQLEGGTIIECLHDNGVDSVIIGRSNISLFGGKDY